MRTIKNTIRVIVVIKMKIIGAGKINGRIRFVKTDLEENKWIK